MRGWGLAPVALGLAGLALGGLPARASAKVHTTSAFSVDLPDAWKVKKIVASKDGARGFWVAKGPSHLGKLYVVVRRKGKAGVRQGWFDFLRRFLSRRVGFLTVTRFDVTKSPTTDAAMGFAYGAGRGRRKTRVYKFGIAAAHEKTRNRVMFAALGATEKKWPEVVKLFEPVMQSLKLVGKN